MTMPDLGPLLQIPAIDTLGWILVHFVWQGAFVAAVLAGALRLLRDQPPSLRYAVSCGTLVLLLALPIGTGVFLGAWAGPGPAPDATVGAESADLTAIGPLGPVQFAEATPASIQAQAAEWVRPALPWIVLSWAAGVILFSLRLAGGAWRVRRLRHSSAPAPEQWARRLRTLSEHMGLGHTVRMRLSSRVESPMVAGWWRPVILVPVGLLGGMPPDQVEALLLHELAHVRRHDVLVGRLQALVETLLFFHPATWWISRRVRQTREACCDDLAVRSGTDRTVYARALASLAEQVVDQSRPVGAVAASDGSLLQRIRRILGSQDAPEKTARRLSAAVAIVLIGGVLVGLAACASQQPTTASDGEEPDEVVIAEAEPRPEEGAPTEPERKGDEIENEGNTVVVFGRDSSEAEVVVRGGRDVEVDSVPGGVFVYTHPKGEPDTIEIRRPPMRVPPKRFERELRLRVHPDSVEIGRPPMRMRPERFEREWRVLGRPDSLGPMIRGKIELDTLARSVRVWADSIDRHLPFVEHPDTLDHRFGAWFEADSMERAFRIDRERLERRAREFRMRADSMERELRLKLRPERMAERARLRALDDSLQIELRKRMEGDRLRGVLRLRADSLAKWHTEHADSLRRMRELHADSVRIHLRELKRRTQREMPERLREQAHRLREQAKRLEERARQMEEAPPEPEDPKPHSDTTETSESGVRLPFRDAGRFWIGPRPDTRPTNRFHPFETSTVFTSERPGAEWTV